jgi:hypothetical protein
MFKIIASALLIASFGLFSINTAGSKITSKSDTTTTIKIDTSYDTSIITTITNVTIKNDTTKLKRVFTPVKKDVVKAKDTPVTVKREVIKPKDTAVTVKIDTTKPKK